MLNFRARVGTKFERNLTGGVEPELGPLWDPKFDPGSGVAGFLIKELLKSQLVEFWGAKNDSAFGVKKRSTFY